MISKIACKNNHSFYIEIINVMLYTFILLKILLNNNYIFYYKKSIQHILMCYLLVKFFLKIFLQT